MTKEQRVKAMGKVIDACQWFKDKKPLAEAIRKIVEDLRAEEMEFREKARTEHAINLARKTAGHEKDMTD